MTDKELEKLWIEFGDISVDDNDCIESDFHIWKKGTDKYDIWEWFDQGFSKGLYYFVYSKNIK